MLRIDIFLSHHQDVSIKLRVYTSLQFALQEQKAKKKKGYNNNNRITLFFHGSHVIVILFFSLLIDWKKEEGKKHELIDQQSIINRTITQKRENAAGFKEI
jgi:hypothetical protein